MHAIETLELRQHLHEQLHFLRKSCLEFDKGDELEVKRIAGPMRVLLHSPKKSGKKSKTVSLIDQLDIKSQLIFVNSGFDAFRFNAGICKELPPGHFGYPVNAAYYPLAAYLGKDNSWYWRALFEESRYSKGNMAHGNIGPCNFDMWWEQEIFLTTEDTFVSRRDVVLSMVDTDGYAHVDQIKGKEYSYLKATDLDFRFGNDDVSMRIKGSLLNALIRQIGFELLLTFERFLGTKEGAKFTLDRKPLKSITPPPSFPATNGQSPLDPDFPIHVQKPTMDMPGSVKAEIDFLMGTVTRLPNS